MCIRPGESNATDSPNCSNHFSLTCHPKQHPPPPPSSSTRLPMATQPTAPPNPTDDNHQNPASEAVQPTISERYAAKAKVNKEISPPSVFVNSEPIREEQVQNAVKFLSHPKVRGSPVIYRRSFLERKGLTKAEIDEAFRLVPDPPQTVLGSQPAGTNQDGQLKSSANVQPHVSTQTLQPVAATPTGVISKTGTVAQSRFHWSHAFLAVGQLALSGAGTAVLFKNTIVPRLRSWIHKVVFEEERERIKTANLKPSLEEEAAAAAKAAAAAAADVARGSREMLISKTEEKKFLEELMNLIGVQVQEMKSMSNAIRKLEGKPCKPEKIPPVEQYHGVSITGSKQPSVNVKVDADLYSARSSSPPTTVEPSVATHPKSYLEIKAMVQRGEKPPNIREINDLPPNPDQPLPNPNLAPRAKPWEVGQIQNSLSQVLQSNAGSRGSNSNLQDNGLNNQLNRDSSLPWWLRKNDRITEIENKDGFKGGSYGMVTSGRPAQHSWVPPQPPPVAMPEAAAAIRQPKKPPSHGQLAGDQSVSNPSDAANELQRIMKISESGGVGDANGGSSRLNTSEIQVEQEEY